MNYKGKTIMSLEESIKTITDLILSSKYLVIFTGAGISTESGLSDYRGPNGVWTRRDAGLKPLPGPSVTQVDPNAAHKIITAMFELGLVRFLISQNVDNLHIRSGFPNEKTKIAELHGNHNIYKCVSCDNRYTKQELKWDEFKYGKGYRTDEPIEGQPKCRLCGARLISSVVNFGDPMPEYEMNESVKHCSNADLMLILGTSLKVQPAASLPIETLKNNGKLVIVNKGETPLDKYAEVKLDDSIGMVMSKVFDMINKKGDHF